MAGRPSSKFEINLNQIEESLKKIETFSSHPSIRQKLKLFSSELTKLCTTFEESETQTNNDCTEDNILDDVLSLTDESKEKMMTENHFFLTSIYHKDQCKFLESVGRTFNETIFNTSTKIQESVSQLTFQNLCG